jgi:death-on-curing protein
VLYLSTEQVLYINETQVGRDMLRDAHLLDSAVMRPRQSVGGRDAYPDIHTKAAALMQSLIKNHPFIDGNKRTGFLAGVVFYGVNGYDLDVTPVQAVRFVLDVATDELRSVEGVAHALGSFAVELPRGRSGS